MKKILILIIFASTLLSLNACKKFSEGETNDEELITTLQLNFTIPGSSSTQSFKFEDLDGPGGNAPVIEPIVLAAGTTYDVSLEVWNKAANPPENTTTEIEEENASHRFYYSPSVGSNIVVSNLNNDDNAVPLGTTSTWQVGTASTGNISITLRHYPGTPPDKQISDPVNSPKSGTDIEVTFNYTIQ